MRIWQLRDGKPGHENQTLGLIDALTRKLGEDKVDCYPLSAPGKLQALWQHLRGTFDAGRTLPKPDLILAAGHGTHAAALAARKAYGGKVVVLMKPSLPSKQFDLCIVPEHDQAGTADNLLQTRGVLNRMQNHHQHDPNRCLLLMGGQSKHAQWDDSHVLKQLQAIAAQAGDTRFILTTSRRTPTSFVDTLKNQSLDVEVHLAEHTAPGWLAEQMNRAGSAWVTADSVSMVYESLSAGLAVGILDLPSPADSRVMRGLDTLVSQGLVKSFVDWKSSADKQLLTPTTPFNEADRIAKELLKRWPALAS